MSQKDRLRDLFLSRPYKWIPLTTILDMRIAQYNTRISELRKEGYHIENRVKEVVRGQKHTEFRYIPHAEGELW